MKKNKFKIISLIFTTTLFSLWLWYLPEFGENLSKAETIAAITLSGVAAIGAFVLNIVHVIKTWRR